MLEEKRGYILFASIGLLIGAFTQAVGWSMITSFIVVLIFALCIFPWVLAYAK